MTSDRTPPWPGAKPIMAQHTVTFDVPAWEFEGETYFDEEATRIIEHVKVAAGVLPAPPDPLRKLLAEAVELIEARHSRISDGRVCDDIPTPELAFLIKARRALQR